MKTIIFFLLAICSAFKGYTQKPAFSRVSLQTLHNRQMLLFSIPQEANVRHYRIEASNDSLNFEVIATVRSKGNSMLATDYSYDLSQYAYAYYRIGKVEMGDKMPYSSIMVVPRKEQQADPHPGMDTLPGNTPVFLADNPGTKD